MVGVMGGKVDRYFIPALIGFAPFVLSLVSWAPEGRTPIQRLLLTFYVPIIAMQLAVIVIALREGLIAAMRRWSWKPVPSTAIIVLVLVAITTAALAPNSIGAWIWTIFWLIHLSFGFAVTHLAERRIAPIDLWVAYLAGFVAFVSSCALFALNVRDPAFDWTHGWPAALHIRHLGYYAAAMTALCIGLAAVERSRKVNALLLGLMTLGATFALWTGSRGAVVGVLGALVIGLIVIPGIRRPIVWGSALVGLVGGFLIASQLPASGPWMGAGRTVTQTVESQDVSSGRTQIWKNAIGAISHRPIFGYGENQMATVAPFHGLGQTHNVILQILLAWGTVGLACVAVLAIWFLIRSVPAVRRDTAGLAPPFMVMAALTTLSAFDGSLFHVVPLSLFAACAGLIASSWTLGIRPSRTDPEA